MYNDYTDKCVYMRDELQTTLSEELHVLHDIAKESVFMVILLLAGG
jgi:hypothetical protein